MNAPAPRALVLAVNVVHEVLPDIGGQVGVTAIDKRPRDGQVQVTTLGLVGDQIMDTKNHGGSDKAVYVFAREDAQAWEDELGREVTPGLFGENVTTLGLDVTGALVGERWRIGDEVVLEPAMPRIPCATFARRLGETQWVKRFTERGAPGAYCRVVTAGAISAEDTVEVIHRPDHDVTVGELLLPRRIERRRLRALLAQPDLAPDLVASLRKVPGVG